MKYIKLYEDSNKCDWCVELKREICKILSELNFKIGKIFPSAIEFQKYLSTGELSEYYVDVINSEIRNSNSRIPYTTLNNFISTLFKVFTIHFKYDKTVDLIFSKHPEYIKYYKETITVKRDENFEIIEVPLIDQISDRMKEKYAYLQNELF